MGGRNFLSLATAMAVLLSPCVSTLTPRVSFPLGSPGRLVVRFSGVGVANTTMLLLNDDGKTLYVGARDAVLALDVSRDDAMSLSRRLDWSPSDKDLEQCSMKGKKTSDCHNFIRVLQFVNSSHLYACGTFAFSPRCSYIDAETLTMSLKPDEGRGRCPYDPYQRNTAIIVDGELYTGTVADYRGNRPVISRHLSQVPRVDLKLDDSLGWLEDPTFISSSFVPDEEKIFFFFSEVGREFDFLQKVLVPRVSQVCRSDVGGQRTLQRRWTTFAKAQLLCQADGELPYNLIQDMDTLPPPGGAAAGDTLPPPGGAAAWDTLPPPGGAAAGDTLPPPGGAAAGDTLPPPGGAAAGDTLFYGIFTSQWSVNSGRSAVCSFSLTDIKAVFSGNYRVLNRDSLQWSSRVQEKVANPGECGLHNASDNALRFVKENFLAEDSVRPVGRTPVLVSSEHSYRKVAVQRVRAANLRLYTVLYLLTDSGFLQKTVLLQDGVHVIEEVQVFENLQPTSSLKLSIPKATILVGSGDSVVKLPTSNCSSYWTCAQCVLARDPFCGWDAPSRECVQVSGPRTGTGLRQDVDRGNVEEACHSVSLTHRTRPGPDTLPAGELVSVSLNEVVRLRCPAVSRLSVQLWERPNSRLSSDLYLHLEDGGLMFVATPATLGHYLCRSTENGYQQTVAVYLVKQRSSPWAQTPTRAGAQTPTSFSWFPQHLAPTRAGAQTPTSFSWFPQVLAPTRTGTEVQPGPRLVSSNGPPHHHMDPRPTPPHRSNQMTPRHPQRNLSLWSGGEPPLSPRGPCYLKELVVVSVLLVLCFSVLTTLVLYLVRLRVRTRTAPLGGSAGRGSPPEQEVPGRKSNRHSGPIREPACNGTLSGSNGHLPNVPI